MKVKTKKIGAGDYETLNTTPTYYMSKCEDGGGDWILYDEEYASNGNTGYYGIWDTKKECVEVVKERL